MGSRTTMKQQIMREMVMAEEKPHKGNANTSIGNYNNLYKGSYNSISQNSDTLPSLTSTIIGSDKNYLYCKPFMNSPNRMNFNIDSNNPIGDDFSLMNNDYSDPISSTDSPYLLHNMYPVENKYSFQSFNTDFSLQSSLIDTNPESNNNSYNSQYQPMGINKPGSSMGQMHDNVYSYKTSFSCPVTGDQMTATTTNQRRMSNSNSAVIGQNLSLNYDDKRIQQKDRSKKESHNRIERKRRDFINQQIIELSTLLPAQMMTEGESKKNKGNILKNSVVYIQHLQNETNNTINYMKETDMAFILVESYRKQIQELQQQLKSGSSQIPSLSVEGQRVSDSYSEYLLLREHNRKTYNVNSQLLLPVNNNNNNGNNLSTDLLNRGSVSSYIKSPLSSVENGSAFKVEPSSAHSSIGTNSLSHTYRIDEETDVGFNSLHDMLSPNIPNQSMSLNYPSAQSKRNDIFFNTSNHYQGLGRHKFESMEC